MRRIAVFGDSIAWGSWDPLGGGWTTRLRVHLMRQAGSADDEPDDYASVHSLAVGGHRVRDILGRVPADLAMLQPPTVIIAIGTNDCPENEQATPLDAFARDYATVLQLAGQAGRVVALTPPPVARSVRPSQHARLPRYRDCIEGLCRDARVTLITRYGDFTETDLCADGLHPKPSGHEKIFGAVLATLSED